MESVSRTAESPALQNLRGLLNLQESACFCTLRPSATPRIDRSLALFRSRALTPLFQIAQVSKDGTNRLLPRVLELSYTAWDLAAFARDLAAYIKRAGS